MPDQSTEIAKLMLPPRNPARMPQVVEDFTQDAVLGPLWDAAKGIGATATGNWNAPEGAGAGLMAAMGMMSPASRGVKPGIRAFHGTNREFDAFRLPESGRERAVFFTDTPQEAEKYGVNTIEANIRPRKVHSVDYTDYSDGDPIYDPEVMQRILAEGAKKKAGLVEIKGVQNFEYGPKSTSYAVLDPSLIEISKPAADASKTEIAQILAGGAAK